MKQFNENWDGVSRNNILMDEAVKVKDGIEIKDGGLIDTKDRLKIGWYGNNKVAEIARDMVIAWAKKNGVSFADGSKAVMDKLSKNKDREGNLAWWKELDSIRGMAAMAARVKK